jgi:Flp pilus assembly protein TadB
MAIALPLVWWMANSYGERRALRRSLAAGAPPPDADLGEWEPRLRSELTRLKLARWLLRGYFIAEAVLLAAVAVTPEESTWGLWLAAGVAVVCAAVLPLWGVRPHQVVERLRAQLPQP